MNHTLGPRVLVLLLVLSILWGGSFFFVGVAVSDLPPFTIVALRVGQLVAGLVRAHRFPFSRPVAIGWRQITHRTQSYQGAVIPVGQTSSIGAYE